jgi:DNA-binding transcriptional MerR regulator
VGDSRYQIDEVSAMTGLTKRSLRYYEEVNLLVPEERSEGRYRLYSDADVAKLRHIVALRDALGYTLDEIKEVLAAEEELARIRTVLPVVTDTPALIAACERALTILQREEERAVRKLEQIAAVRQRYLERIQRTKQRLVDLRAEPRS